jgi:hypothetical protein
MMKKLTILLMALFLSFGTLAGCYQTGKVTGEAAEEVEEGAEEFGEGYEEGKE